MTKNTIDMTIPKIAIINIDAKLLFINQFLGVPHLGQKRPLELVKIKPHLEQAFEVCFFTGLPQFSQKEAPVDIIEPHCSQ